MSAHLRMVSVTSGFPQGLDLQQQHDISSSIPPPLPLVSRRQLSSFLFLLCQRDNHILPITRPLSKKAWRKYTPVSSAQTGMLRVQYVSLRFRCLLTHSNDGSIHSTTHTSRLSRHQQWRANHGPATHGPLSQTSPWRPTSTSNSRTRPCNK